MFLPVRRLPILSSKLGWNSVGDFGRFSGLFKKNVFAYLFAFFWLRSMVYPCIGAPPSLVGALHVSRQLVARISLTWGASGAEGTSEN